MPVFFDLDDTLIDHSTANRLAALSVFEAYNGELKKELSREPEYFLQCWNMNHQNRFNQYLRREITLTEQRRARVKEVLGQEISNDKADEVALTYLTAYENNWQLFSDVFPCLERLTNNLRINSLGIITNGDRQQISKLIRTGIINYFQVIVCSKNYGISKPDPQIFQEACRQMNCRLENAVYVGDNLEHDTKASITAGMRGIWLNRNGKERAEEVVEMIRSLDELML